MSVRICIHVSVRICIHVSVRICIHVSVRIGIHVSVRICIHVSVRPCVLRSGAETNDSLADRRERDGAYGGMSPDRQTDSVAGFHGLRE